MAFIFVAVMLLSGCGWFHRKPPAAPEMPELVVTGSPQSSLVYVDGVQQGSAAVANDKPRIFDVAAGDHVVEVRMGDTVVYRENIFLKGGERRTVTVLSGSNRE